MVPLNDLRRGYAALRREIDDAVGRVLSSGYYVMGPEHDAFESELAQALGVEHVIAVGNGTDALEIALAAVGVGPRSDVITVSNAGMYASTATRKLGAKPKYVDVDEVDLLMAPESLARQVTSSTRAVVVTHLYGRMAPVRQIARVCHRFRLPLIEDCAQSIGARLGEQQAGAFGDLAILSFYPTKNLGAFGDGGAVVTNRSDLAVIARQLRQYGWTEKYRVTREGGRNSRLDEVQAAILRVRLPHLEAGNARRRRILESYQEAARGVGMRVLGAGAGKETVAHLAVLVADDRSAVASSMARAGIATAVHYPIPDHLQVVHEGAGISLPVTESYSRRILTIPCFPELEDQEVARVQDAISGVPRR